MTTENNLQVMKKILNIQDSIRKKAASIKLSRSIEDETLNKLYKPLVKPLEQITENTKQQTTIPLVTSNFIPKINKKLNFSPFLRGKKKPKTEEIYSYNSPSEDETEYLPSNIDSSDVFNVTPRDMLNNPTVSQEFLSQYDSVPRQYLEEMLVTGLDNLNSNGYDTTQYALKYDDSTDKWFIGDSECKIIDDTLQIKDKIYPGTKGLFELLLKSYPVGYSEDDEINYRDILNITNAVRRSYDPLQQHQGNSSHKYQFIIKKMISDSNSTPVSSRTRSQSSSSSGHKLLKQKKQGRGYVDNAMIVDNKKQSSYTYWNNPNELVERLALLVSSKNASDNSHIHDNEIASILEELREDEYIY